MGNIFFGTIDGDIASMQYVPCFLAPLATTLNRYTGSVEFENGGRHSVSSADGHKRYDLSFKGYDGDSASIDTVMDYYHGEYGNGFIYFTDPALLGTGHNLFRRNWATPHLIEQGYKNLYHSPAVYTPPPTAGMLPTMSWETDGTQGRFFTIPIPTGYTLHFGARYTATGTAEIAVYDRNGYVAPITQSAIDSNALYTDSMAGEQVARFAIIGDEGDTIEIQSMDAILLPTGVSAPATGTHIRGQGVSGLKFSSESVPYEHIFQATNIRQFSVELVEVEEWS